MILKQKARISSILALILSVLSFMAALTGILDTSLYRSAEAAGNISDFLVTGSVAQDLVVLPGSILLAVISLVLLFRSGIKTLVLNMGLISFIFYAYGLYVMQGQYTALYLVYLAIFGLSIYALVYGLLAIKWAETGKTMLPKSLRYLMASFLLLIPVALVPVWLMMILPDMAAHTPSDTYAVFILDLAIVFPALGIIAWLLIMNRPAGNILGGVALLKALTVCLSVAFGEWYHSFSNQTILNAGMLGIFLPLSLLSLALVILYFRKLKTVKSPQAK